jgi:hypothetical protein
MKEGMQVTFINAICRGWFCRFSGKALSVLESESPSWAFMMVLVQGTNTRTKRLGSAFAGGLWRLETYKLFFQSVLEATVD